MNKQGSSYIEDRVFVAGWGIFVGLMTLFFLGIFMAPLFERWSAHSISRFIYGFYHLSCHQLPSRSWFVCGGKLGVCVRCFSIYLLLVASGSLFFLRRIRYWLASRKFTGFVLPVFVSALSPLVADGLLQLFTKWESTNLLRFVTGSLAGIGLSVFLGFLFLKISGAVDDSLTNR